jgi:hypothetical protein
VGVTVAQPQVAATLRPQQRLTPRPTHPPSHLPTSRLLHMGPHLQLLMHLHSWEPWHKRLYLSVQVRQQCWASLAVLECYEYTVHMTRALL